MRKKVVWGVSGGCVLSVERVAVLASGGFGWHFILALGASEVFFELLGPEGSGVVLQVAVNSRLSDQPQPDTLAWWPDGRTGTHPALR